MNVQKRLKVIKWIEKNQNFLSDSQINNDFGEPIDDEIGNLEWGQIYNEIKQEYKEMHDKCSKIRRLLIASITTAKKE